MEKTEKVSSEIVLTYWANCSKLSNSILLASYNPAILCSYASAVRRTYTRTYMGYVGTHATRGQYDYAVHAFALGNMIGRLQP